MEIAGKFELTETGRAFAAGCRTIIAAAQHAQDVATHAQVGLAGTLRIGVVTSALGEPLLSTIRAFQQHRDSYIIALPADHPAAGTSRPADLARFADEPWVWLRRDISPDYHDQLLATCHQAGFTPDVRHIANSIATQLAMVACGLGVTLVPGAAVRSAIPPAAAYRPLTSPAELVELSLVTRDSPHEPLVREFLRIALTYPHDTA